MNKRRGANLIAPLRSVGSFLDNGELLLCLEPVNLYSAEKR